VSTTISRRIMQPPLRFRSTCFPHFSHPGGRTRTVPARKRYRLEPSLSDARELPVPKAAAGPVPEDSAWPYFHPLPSSPPASRNTAPPVAPEPFLRLRSSKTGLRVRLRR